MVEEIIRYTLRVDRELFRKFRYVAEWEGRSANRELEQLMKRRVARFEEERGPIDPEDLQ